MHPNTQNPQGIVEPNDCNDRLLWMNLNQQFLHDIQQLERSLGGMDQPQRSLISEWIHKLKINAPTLDEAVARNKILAYLLNFMAPALFFKKPFCSPTMFQKFSHISDAMAAEKCSTNKARELLCSSYDKGAFAGMLPVPRNGAFFVIHLRQNCNK